MVKAWGKVPAMAVLGITLAVLGCSREERSSPEEGTGLVESASARTPERPPDRTPPPVSTRDRGPLPDPDRAVREGPREASLTEDTPGVPERTDPGRSARASESEANAANSRDPEPREKPRVERRPPTLEAPEPLWESLPLERREEGMRVPAGSRIELVVETPLSSRRAWPGDRFRARVVEDLLDSTGMVLVPMGAVVEGAVSRVVRGEGDDGEPLLEIRAEALLMEGRVYDLEAEVADAEFRTEGVPDGREMAGKAAAGAAAGAILGKILGKDAKSTIAGAVAGAAAGTAVAAATGEARVVLDQGAHLEIELLSDLLLEDRAFR